MRTVARLTAVESTSPVREVEAALDAHAAVTAAVAVARGEDQADLTAYVIPRGVPVSGEALKRFLAQKLPAQMVPSSVMLLDALPLDENGEVRWQALPEPPPPSDPHEPVAPRSALEQKLASIWERELGIGPIGVSENLFDLGVTSTAVASMLTATEHELGERLTLGAIFQAPSIETLAALLEAGEKPSRWTSLVPIQPAGTQPPIYCVHGGSAAILHFEPLARELGEDQPFYGLQSQGLYGGVVPPQTVEAMASHYLSEMRQVHRGGPWRLAGYCFGAIVAFEMAQQLLAADEQVELLAMINGPSPAWIERWGWFGNQPTQRAARASPVRTTRRERMAPVPGRLARAMREPHRFRTATVRHVWRLGGGRLARLARALAQPLPVGIREHYFLRLHASAERAYRPTPYDGDLLIFYGEGLYEDPQLGWEGMARGEIRSVPVPGRHVNNRQAMVEPYVAFLGERLQAHLRQGRATEELNARELVGFPSAPTRQSSPR